MSTSNVEQDQSTEVAAKDGGLAVPAAGLVHAEPDSSEASAVVAESSIPLPEEIEARPPLSSQPISLDQAELSLPLPTGTNERPGADAIENTSRLASPTGVSGATPNAVDVQAGPLSSMTEQGEDNEKASSQTQRPVSSAQERDGVTAEQVSLSQTAGTSSPMVTTVPAEVVKEPLPADASPPQSPQPEHVELGVAAQSAPVSAPVSAPPPANDIATSSNLTQPDASAQEVGAPPSASSTDAAATEQAVLHDTSSKADASTTSPSASHTTNPQSAQSQDASQQDGQDRITQPSSSDPGHSSSKLAEPSTANAGSSGPALGLTQVVDVGTIPTSIPLPPPSAETAALAPSADTVADVKASQEEQEERNAQPDQIHDQVELTKPALEAAPGQNQQATAASKQVEEQPEADGSVEAHSLSNEPSRRDDDKPQEQGPPTVESISANAASSPSNQAGEGDSLDETKVGTEFTTGPATEAQQPPVGAVDNAQSAASAEDATDVSQGDGALQPHQGDDKEAGGKTRVESSSSVAITQTAERRQEQDVQATGGNNLESAKTGATPVANSDAPQEVGQTVTKSQKDMAATDSPIAGLTRSSPSIPAIASSKEARRVELVLSANQELIRLCVTLQAKSPASSLFRDASHRLQTNLAFLAGIADQSQRGTSKGPSTTPRIDVFPHPSLSAELTSVDPKSPLPQLYVEMGKAFEGSARMVPAGVVSANGAPEDGGKGSLSSPGNRKHSRESSTVDEPQKKRPTIVNGARVSNSPAPQTPLGASLTGAQGVGGPNRPRQDSVARSASPAGSNASQNRGPELAGQGQPHQPSPTPLPPQQAQQLMQTFGPSAPAMFRMLQNYLRSPQCSPQFAALPVPMQMQHIATMQQQRQRMNSQSNRPSTPNAPVTSSPGSMGPPAPVSGGEGPGSLLRRSMSGEVATARGTPPSIPMQVMNPFAATGGNGGVGSPAASSPIATGSNTVGGSAQFANLAMANGLQTHQQQQQVGGQLPQPGGQYLPADFATPSQSPFTATGGIQGGGNLQQQLQAIQQMQQQQLRQQSQQPQHTLSNGGVNGATPNPMPMQTGMLGSNGAPDLNQLPPHLQQLFAAQQMQSAPGVPGNVAWNNGQQLNGINPAMAGINPSALYGNLQQQQPQPPQAHQQQQQHPAFNNWNGM